MIPVSPTFLAFALLSQNPTPAPPPPPVSTSCPQASVALPAPLDRVLRDYETAWSGGDEKALAGLFAEDGFLMSMGALPVRGRAAIEKEYAQAGGTSLSLRAIAFATDGSTGFILGCYAWKPNEADQGKFTLTLKKDPAGRWLIFSDMDNPNRRPTRPSAP
ncbi:MAG: nuclear transport factor 2 family protein [Vicinamibacteria bacterium]|jgi:ketosteroid isomerase-like protein|nr:nuclear transport factor 2 family protein [Vicinamibacteria bacterium]MBP9945111.1 nuclear transport factor 2 family protein [Vicinamibacteria bacterium]